MIPPGSEPKSRFIPNLCAAFRGRHREMEGEMRNKRKKRV
jgi:hypothetical protein